MIILRTSKNKTKISVKLKSSKMVTSWRKVIWAALVMSWTAIHPTLTKGLKFPQVIWGDWVTALSALSGRISLFESSPPGESLLYVGTR